MRARNNYDDRCARYLRTPLNNTLYSSVDNFVDWEAWKKGLQTMLFIGSKVEIYLATFVFKICQWFHSVLYNTVEPGYNDISLCDISLIASDILWCQLIPHCEL
jgi:hypothetical protein